MPPKVCENCGEYHLNDDVTGGTAGTVGRRDRPKGRPEPPPAVPRLIIVAMQLDLPGSSHEVAHRFQNHQ